MLRKPFDFERLSFVSWKLPKRSGYPRPRQERICVLPTAYLAVAEVTSMISRINRGGRSQTGGEPSRNRTNPAGLKNRRFSLRMETQCRTAFSFSRSP